MPEYLRKPSAPVVQELEVTPAPGVVAPAAIYNWQPLCSVRGKGAVSCCDVWIVAPIAWLTGTIRLWVVSGAVRVPVLERAIVDVEHYHPISESSATPGQFAALLCSVRGRQCDGFDVDFLPDAGVTAAYGTATIRMEAWYDLGAADGDNASRQQVALFARTDQQVTAAVSFALAGTFTLLTPPANRRIVLTHVDMSGTGGPSIWQLETRVPPAAAATVLGIQVQLRANPSFEFTYPLRGPINGIWQLTSALFAPTTYNANVIGFVE